MGNYPAILYSPTLNKAIDTFFDPTFAGIHKLGWFDWALLIPYFSVLIVLSFYGLHRYEMIRGYLKHPKSLPTARPRASSSCPKSRSSSRSTTRSSSWSALWKRR